MTVKRVGIIGSGQLGRMMALAGTPLDVEFVFYDPAINSPCSNLGLNIDSSKSGSLQEFIDSVNVITYESENTDANLVDKISEQVPVYPSSKSLIHSQHRLTEKSMFRSLGIATANFLRVTSLEELKEACESLGLPLVIKTTTLGYDGKGQAVIKTHADIITAWEKLKGSELIAEQFIQFSRELSIIAVRDQSGNTQIYPIAENDHANGILRISRIPAKALSAEKFKQAQQYITTLLNHLEHVGVITLELFDTEDGLIANEMAPRVHNSGHWSMEGAYCGQFENHIRAITGMPLGCTELRQDRAAMINIIGLNGNRNLVLETQGAFLHAYGKAERADRKIGHINIIANNEAELESRILVFKDFMTESGQ